LRRARWGRETPATPRRGRWSQSEIARLKEFYGLKDERAIARELSRPVESVRKMAASLFPAAVRSGPWSAAEVAELKRYIGGATPDVIARILGRSVEDLERKVEELRSKTSGGRWTQEELVEFKRMYGTRTDQDLALIFERSVEAVKRLASKFCLAKDKAFLKKLVGPSASKMPRWEPAEIEKLVVLYPVEPNLGIAQKLNRSVKSVVSKAHNLGLKKVPDRLRQMGRENVSLRYKRASSVEP
jgi:DNA-binding Lrp family transcriptional regulator